MCCCKKKKQHMNETGKDLSNSYDSMKNNVTHEITAHNYRK